MADAWRMVVEGPYGRVLKNTITGEIRLEVTSPQAQAPNTGGLPSLAPSLFGNPQMKLRRQMQDLRQGHQQLRAEDVALSGSRGGQEDFALPEIQKRQQNLLRQQDYDTRIGGGLIQREVDEAIRKSGVTPDDPTVGYSGAYIA